MAEYARPAGWPDVPLVDTDVHITPRSIAALMPYLPARWRDYIRESGVAGLESDLYPPRSPLSRDPRRPARRRAARLRPRAPAYAAARPVAPARRRHPLHLRHRRHPQPRLGRRDGPRGQRLAAHRVARGRPAAARLGRRRGPGPGPGGGGDRPGRRPPGVRAGAPAGADARAAGHPGVLADLRGRRAARAGARRLRGRRERQSRSRRSGRRATTWRSTSGCPRRSRPRSSAWSARACRCGSRDLPIVLVESGFTWLPPLMWRLDKNWKGLRREVPWVDRLPSEMIRESLRLTAQPLDAPRRRARPAARGPRPARQRPHADVRHRLPAPPVRRPGARGARGPVRGRDARFLGGNALATYRLE